MDTAATRGPAQHRVGNLPGAALVFAALFLVDVLVDSKALDSIQITELFNSSTTLALAAAGATLVVISGGFDLSVGSILSLVNVVLATQLGAESGASEPLAVVLAIAVGVGAGAVNGVLIGLLRMPSVIATLATSFIWAGVALLVLPTAGAAVEPDFASRYTGTLAGALPTAALILAGLLLLWAGFRRTRVGTVLYALGSNREAVVASGVRPGLATVRVHAAAGFCYGLAGVFLAARTGSGDPGVGAPMVLGVYTAIAVGGTALGGGRGGLAGSIVGAFTVTIIANVLFALGVSSFYTYICTGAVLVAAVAFNTLRERIDGR